MSSCTCPWSLTYPSATVTLSIDTSCITRLLLVLGIVSHRSLNSECPWASHPELNKKWHCDSQRSPRRGHRTTWGPRQGLAGHRAPTRPEECEAEQTVKGGDRLSVGRHFPPLVFLSHRNVYSSMRKIMSLLRKRRTTGDSPLLPSNPTAALSVRDSWPKRPPMLELSTP